MKKGQKKMTDVRFDHRFIKDSVYLYSEFYLKLGWIIFEKTYTQDDFRSIWNYIKRLDCAFFFSDKYVNPHHDPQPTYNDLEIRKMRITLGKYVNEEYYANTRIISYKDVLSQRIIPDTIFQMVDELVDFSANKKTEG